MLISCMGKDPLGVSVMRADGAIRNFDTGRWELSAKPPTASQFIPFTRPGAGPYSAIQWADIPGVEGTDLIDDARCYGCFRLNGTARYAVLFAPPVTATKVFSWMCWCRRRGPVAPNCTLIGAGSSASQSQLFAVRSDTMKGAYFELAARDGTNSQVLLIGSMAIGEAWHHVAATCDGDTLGLYVDGEPDGSTSVASLGAFVLDRFSVGGLERADPGFFWRGDVDDVRTYTRPLTASEIAAAASRWMAGPNGGGELSLAIWSLSGGVPTALVDVVALSWYAPGRPMAGGMP